MKIEFKKGDKYLPARLKIMFGNVPWYLTIRTHSPYGESFLTEEDLVKLSLRDGIDSFLDGLKKEIYDAIKEREDIDLR